MIIKRYFWIFASLIILLGGTIGYKLDRYSQKIKRNDIERVAKTLSVAINYQNIEALKGDSSDIQTPEYKRLKEQLTMVLDKNSEYRFIYLMRIKEGKVIFLLDNQSTQNSIKTLDSSLASVGQIYEDTTTGLMNVFRDHRATVTGPEKDIWGTFYSGLAPVISPKTGELIAVLGVDVLENEWNHNRILSHGFVTLFTLLFIVALYLLLRYINGVKKYQRTINESQKRFKDIANLSTDWIWEVDLKGTYLYCSPKINDILGYQVDEVIGKTAFDFIIPNDINRSKEVFAEIVSKKESLKSYIHTCITKNNQEVVIESNGIAVFDSNDILVGYRGYDKDITEKLRNEKKLLESKEAAEQANRIKSEFLANMSHEIRTPINGIMGMTELALLTRLSEPQRDYLQSIQFSAYSLLDVVNDILDFSKIEAGKLDIEEIAFDLRDTIENTVPIIGAKCLEREIELLCYIDPKLPQTIVGDSVRFKQVLINLLSNAIKFTHQGEILTKVELETQNQKEWIVFTVKDTGIGIEQANLNKIFHSFQQADSGTTRKYGGTGLGLTISKSLVEHMGGQIWVESTLGEGSIFGFKIPLKTEIKTQLKFEPIPLKHVLVVDDNSTNLNIIHQMLNWFGIHNEICDSPESAITYVQNNKDVIDTIIIDYQMPGMNGSQLIDYLLKTINFKKVPFMMMFSSANRESLFDGITENNVQYYITKPVKMRDLHSILQIISGKQIQVKEEQHFDSSPTNKLTSNLKIMIVEDNPINMKIIRLILNMGGYNPIEANNGNEAVEKYASIKPQLIFMDVHMPDIDGLTATKIIRSMETDTRVPIIALTADAMKGDREKCIDAGMDDYITKPFKQKEIYSMIEKHLTKNSDEKENSTES